MNGNKVNRWERARALRYKRAALESIGWDMIYDQLYEISEACSDVRWYIEDDGDNILAAMDGDEDEVYEFKMAFADLEAKCEQMNDILQENYDIGEYFDDCTVALIGNRYNLVGYDAMEEDYYSLARYDATLAEKESAKRVMRWTKSEMIEKIGQCMGITLAVIDLRSSYDYLKATMDIIRGENMSIIKVVKEIEEEYNKVDESGFYKSRDFDKLVSMLPERAWLE